MRDDWDAVDYAVANQYCPVCGGCRVSGSGMAGPVIWLQNCPQCDPLAAWQEVAKIKAASEPCAWGPSP